MKENNETPQLTGVVIITLPPADNPSLGKTITAFTISDSPPTPTPTPHNIITQGHQQLNHHQEQHHPQQSSQLYHFSFKRLIFGNPRLLFGFLGISLVALSFYISVFQETLFELRDTDDDHKSNSFIFPLYPKMDINGNSQSDVEFKLGRFVDFDSSGIVVENGKISKSISAESKVDSTTIVPVRGNIYPDGLYYTIMLVGHPPKPYYLDMDTGSDLTWIQCDAPCASCAKGAHPLYKPTKDNIIPSKDSYCVETQRNQRSKYCETCHQCDYEIEYADHSSSIGVLARDKLHLILINGSLAKSNIVFGCAYDQQGLLLNSLSKTDGIIGLTKAKISLPSQLASQGIIKNVIGHCLPKEASGGGYMFLGDGFVPYWQMASVPMLNSPSMNAYQTELMKISYGGRQLSLGGADNGPGRVVFDSGSSFTYFAEEAYNELVVAIIKDVSAEGLVQDASDATLPICWRAIFPVRSVADVRKLFKPLKLQLGSKWWIISTELQIPPEGYLTINKKGDVCLGILNGSKLLGGSTLILGDISLRGQLFVYDNVNQKIGWTRSDCTRPRRFDKLPVL